MPSDRPVDPRVPKPHPQKAARRDRQLAVARALLAGPLRKAEWAERLGVTLNQLNNLTNRCPWFDYDCGDKAVGEVRWHLTDAGRAALGHNPAAAPKPSPMTSDRVYDDEEREFLRAFSAWQRRTGKKFPTACDYLAVLKGLGYAKAGGVA